MIDDHHLSYTIIDSADHTTIVRPIRVCLSPEYSTNSIYLPWSVANIYQVIRALSLLYIMGNCNDEVEQLMRIYTTECFARYKPPCSLIEFKRRIYYDINFIYWTAQFTMTSSDIGGHFSHFTRFCTLYIVHGNAGSLRTLWVFAGYFKIMQPKRWLQLRYTLQHYK